MFDALLYCSIMAATMRHTGIFAVAASVMAAAKAKWDGLRAAALRGRRNPPPALCCPSEVWMQSLARLETYVAAMA